VAVELAVVDAAVDERRTVDWLVAVEGSVVDDATALEWVNCTAWPHWTVCLDQVCFVSVSITNEAAEITS